jgi:hypothetical protein
MAEGYVKFSTKRNEGIFPFPQFKKLNSVRTKLHQYKLIGVYQKGIGYGNISVRVPNFDCFIISGTATGTVECLSKDQYCKVTSFDVKKNFVQCTGKVDASSESMTHGAVYLANKSINCVIHIHHYGLWKHMLKEGYPKTSSSAKYGTPELALNTRKVVAKEGYDTGIIVLKGHKEGIIAFGHDVVSAEKILLDTIETSKLLIL